MPAWMFSGRFAEDRNMKNAVWRGRFVVLCLAATTVLTAGGCGGLSDRQLSSIFQSVLSTGLTTLMNTVITAFAGTA